MDVSLSPIPADTSVKYFFPFYQKLFWKNPTCHRNTSTLRVCQNLLGTKQKKIMKENFLVCFGSLLLSLEPDQDRMTSMTIMHTIVIFILFVCWNSSKNAPQLRHLGSPTPKWTFAARCRYARSLEAAFSHVSLQACKKWIRKRPLSNVPLLYWRMGSLLTQPPLHLPSYCCQISAKLLYAWHDFKLKGIIILRKHYKRNLGSRKHKCRSFSKYFLKCLSVT